MPDVYTPGWYDAVQVAINERVATLPDVPSDSFNIAVEIVGDGKIANLQKMRNDADSVSEGEQFGAVIESKLAIAEGDILEITTKS